MSCVVQSPLNVGAVQSPLKRQYWHNEVYDNSPCKRRYVSPQSKMNQPSPLSAQMQPTAHSSAIPQTVSPKRKLEDSGACELPAASNFLAKTRRILDMPMGYGHFSPEADSASTMPINQSDCLQPRGDVQLIRENGPFAMDMESSEQKLSLFASGELVMHSVAAEYSRRSQSTVIPRPSSLPSLPSLPADAALQWQLVPYNPLQIIPSARENSAVLSDSGRFAVVDEEINPDQDAMQM